MPRYIGNKNIVFLISVYFTIAMFAVAGVVSILLTQSQSGNAARETYVNGYFSVDGGRWIEKTDNTVQGRGFKEVTLRGKLAVMPEKNEFLILQVCNAWINVYSRDGVLVGTNKRPDSSFLHNTAGNSITYIPRERISDDGEIRIVITKEPTLINSSSLDDVIMTYVGGRDSMYELLIGERMIWAMLTILLSVSGLFSFAIAGFVMGGIEYRYITFSLTAFFGGLYLLTDILFKFLPLFIDNPAACLIADEVISYMFLVSALSFVRASLLRKPHRIVSDVMIIMFMALGATALALQFADVLTLYQFGFYYDSLFIICCVILSVFLFLEIKENPEAKNVLLSWLPIGGAIIFVAVNSVLRLTDERIPMVIGITLTLLSQIVFLVLKLRDRYYANLEYEHMQKELYEARVAIMVSQIQPHFLYNSLTSIAMMCTKDPKKAREATINFADYLRGNMNSLKERNPVPFPRELEHLKKYLMLEKMRFGDLLNIEYDIQCEDFSLPQLSVQPLVENAVKHGVGMKEDGGTVKISTYEDDLCRYVEVHDDGVGFEVNVPKNDGRSHVGMENVKNRLDEMCGGRVEINSEPGAGTTAKIIIPKQRQEMTI